MTHSLVVGPKINPLRVFAQLESKPIDVGRKNQIFVDSHQREMARTELDAVALAHEETPALQTSPLLSKQASPIGERLETVTDMGMLPTDDVLIGEPDQTQKVS